MGTCMGGGEVKEEKLQAREKKPELESVDVVKFKLKKARDTIKHFVSAKTKDLNQIEDKIQEKVPAYKETGNKKELVPLLKAKKDILKMIESGDTRLKLINEKID